MTDKWFTTKQQMHRALSAMRLELKPEIADDITAKVLAFVDQQQADIDLLVSRVEVMLDALERIHGTYKQPHDPLFAPEIAGSAIERLAELGRKP